MVMAFLAFLLPFPETAAVLGTSCCTVVSVRRVDGVEGGDVWLAECIGTALVSSGTWACTEPRPNSCWEPRPNSCWEPRSNFCWEPRPNSCWETRSTPPASCPNIIVAISDRNTRLTIVSSWGNIIVMELCTASRIDSFISSLRLLDREEPSNSPLASLLLYLAAGSSQVCPSPCSGWAQLLCEADLIVGCW